MTLDRLAPDDFARALRQGRGAAQLHVLSHGLEGVTDLVLAACLEDQAYDAQCEGDRAPWLYRMFKGSSEYALFQQKIIAELGQPSKDASIEQLCELLALMGRDGDQASGDALRKFFSGQIESQSEDWYGRRAIVALDGFAAIVQIARRNGQLLQKYPYPSFDSLDDLVDGDDALAATLSDLQAHADGDADIAVYLHHQQQYIAERLAYQQQTPAQRLAREEASRVESLAKFSLEQVFDGATSHDRARGKFFRFGRLCSEADRIAVLDRLSIEADVGACLRLLWVFHAAAPPYIPARLWLLAEHPDPFVQDAALIALAQVRNPAVGEFGRRYLEREGFCAADASAIELFTQNYRAGDEEIILRSLNTLRPDEFEAHDIGMSIRAFGERHGGVIAAKILAWLYKTNPCTICRAHAIELMVDAGTLDPEVARECAFDAKSSVRELVGQAR